MSTTPDPRIAIMAGDQALPRKNGELVFQAPWEGRAFGVAVALNDQGQYAWREFRDQLVAEIAAAEAGQSPSTYYERWLAALEKIVLDHGLITPEELDARTTEYVSGERDDDDH
jgi:nitrile hydratase accessory protein